MKFALALSLTLATTLARAAPEQWTASATFDVAAHLGNLSPYKKAAVPHGVEAELPDDCEVEQVMLVRPRPPCSCPWASFREAEDGRRRTEDGELTRRRADAQARLALPARVGVVTQRTDAGCRRGLMGCARHARAPCGPGQIATAWCLGLYVIVRHVREARAPRGGQGGRAACKNVGGLEGESGLEARR